MIDERELLDRRAFIARGGMALGAGALALTSACDTAPDRRAPAASRTPDLRHWDDVRGEFDLDSDYLHFGAFVLASHPRSVRAAIDRYRGELDGNTLVYLNENEAQLDHDVAKAAAGYLGAAQPDEVALTDSTTMGLALLYGGLELRPGQEVLATEHDFYSTHESLRLRAERTGASFTKVRLYDDGDVGSVTKGQIVEALRRHLARHPRTRAVAVTWVHSSTGMKLPIRALADAIAETNRNRDDVDRVLLCVDGVHGFGLEDVTVDELGCDFLASGCHKWLFGPRGTGVLWGRADAWDAVDATIPSFDGRSIVPWIVGSPPTDLPPGPRMTPGGFKAFEHRWALIEAFAFHHAIGKRAIAERTHSQATQLKQGLAEMPGVRLITPMAEELSAGIVCFEIEGQDPRAVVDALRNLRRIIASVTPYAPPFVRLGPSIVTTPEEVDEVLRVIRSLS